MAVFNYVAADAADSTRSGTLVADSPWDGRRKLREQGLRVLSFEPARMRSAGAGARLYSGKRRTAQVAELARHLALLLAAGVPLAEGLDVLARQQQPRLSALLKDLRDRLQGGSALADALAVHPGWFDRLFISAVRVGEVSGNLDESLRELAEHMRVRQNLRNQLTAALTYPLILTIVGVAVVLFLMSFVVPQLLAVLVASGKPLPVSTVLLKTLSDWVILYWWALLLVISVATATVLGLSRNAECRRTWHRIVLRVPLVGPLIQKSVVADFAQQMALLLRTGVPFVEAARTIESLSRNIVLADELETIAAAVESGSDIAPAMDGSRIFPPVVVHLIAVGQDSGELTAMLSELRTRYEHETRLALQRFATALEPLLIVILAGAVGFVVFACMMPVLEATRGIS